MKFRPNSLKHVKDVGSISLELFCQMLHDYVTSHIKEVNQDPIDPSLLRLLCNWVEEASANKTHLVDSKLDKKKIVIDEYIKLKPSAGQNAEYKKVLDKLVDDLWATKQIKKISLKKRLYYLAVDFLKARME